jgi:uncharacterized membrane protein YsdA (DUF1294 family)
MYLLFGYLIFINILALVLTVSDKRRAIKHKERISEFTLMLVALLGGSVTMYITMLFIRHKTRHLKFMLGIPVIILIQLFTAFMIWRSIYA